MRSHNIGISPQMSIQRSQKQQATQQKQGFTGNDQAGANENSPNTRIKFKLTQTHINLLPKDGIANENGDVISLSSKNQKSQTNKNVKPGIEYYNTALKTALASGVLGAVAFISSTVASSKVPGLEGLKGIGKRVGIGAAAAALPLLTLPTSIHRTGEKIQKKKNEMNVRAAIDNKLAEDNNSAKDIKDLAKATRSLKSKSIISVN